MIFGIGCDVVDMRRLRRMLERHPRRLPARLLSEAEQNEFEARKFDPAYVAGRVAAKEALAKALRSGIRSPLTWRRIEALGAGGAPLFRFAPSIVSWLEERGAGACHLSISHDGDYAAAFVVVESAAQPPA